MIQAVRKGEPVGILLKMAKDIGAQPALLARNVLEKHCGRDDSNVSRNEVSKLFKDTTLIQDKDLAYEVYLCILYDNLYGPITDAIGISVGQEYELKLQNCLTERNLAFRNEEHLRSRGYDKTPDFKLEVPIAVNGFVINWIESKARFGNMEIHQKDRMANKTTTNLKSQEQPMKTAVQLQLARIKIEEEEELWISGEELYTEGSSDEEEYKQLKSRRKINNNKSSRASPVNPNVERRSCSPFSTETKTSLDHSANGPMDSITKKQTVPNTSSTFDKTTSTFEKLLDSSVESQQIQHFSTTESPATCIMKDTNTSDFFIEENQVDNTEISWKAKKGTFVLPNSSNNAKEESNKC
ncbi:uncharacterized protein LOC122399098 isoform X2 [Colletes gigas]|uniref:uncharacterized protein LOC122399098 isoform X2 n=1 Tax=Colletes gigas TaxID=935657 RepID=UPI001C9AD59E|nr:uncharacterized protein LOC122399098 isoform X2 [Colletes gigas]